MTQETKENLIFGAFILLLVAGFIWILLTSKVKAEVYYPEENLEDCFLNSQNSPLWTETSVGWREVSAYNALPEQTDQEPCISASGMDICKTTKRIAASNEFEFGQKLLIVGEVWEVQDRLNSRYQHRIDLLMPTEREAKIWGLKIEEVQIIN